MAINKLNAILILNSPEWERADRLGLLAHHPEFLTLARAAVARLRQLPGHAPALNWCTAELRPCSKVYPRSTTSSRLHYLFERDTGRKIDHDVFAFAASDAGLPVDCPPGLERLRIGAHRVDVRRVEQRESALPRSFQRRAAPLLAVH